MKKSLPYIYAVVFSLALGLLCYFLSRSIPVSIGVDVLGILSLSFFVVPLLKRKSVTARKRRECFRFVSSFVVSLSLTGSVEKSLESASADAKGELLSILHSVEEYDIRERVKYLESYFESESYSMFLSLYGLYEEQGGDFLDLARELMDELARIEEAANIMEKDGASSLREFIMTWLLSLGIVSFLRYGLANFYDSLVQNLLYVSALAVFFGFFLFAISFYFYVYAGKPKLSSLRPNPGKGGKA
ncbi:MAG: hypothetical protein J5736_01145 [Bacilli bacterium]|nr:hypothetical protein [Bacilli bacterium]